jgi:CRP/FNR family cyclic AMP-dependent transcriptional regulator
LRQRRAAMDFESYVAPVRGGKALLKCQRNQIVYSQGDPADSVFFIREGRVKVGVTSEHGKEATIALLEEGDCFGEGCLNGQAARLSTVKTMTDSVIVRLEKKVALRLLHDHPEFAETFLSYTLARKARVEQDLVHQLFNSSEQRLARLLVVMANFAKDAKPEQVVAKINQETLAEMIGTTRSRVNVFMNKFRKLGFIEYNGDLKIHKSLLDMVLHAKPEVELNGDRTE